jgi:hypothetical protein
MPIAKMNIQAKKLLDLRKKQIRNSQKNVFLTLHAQIW